MKPVNKHILVEMISNKTKEEKTTSTFLLPENYKTHHVERYTRVRIIACADDCKANYSGEAYVETSMIEDISINGELYHIVPENYIVLIMEA